MPHLMPCNRAQSEALGALRYCNNLATLLITASTVTHVLESLAQPDKFGRSRRDGWASCAKPARYGNVYQHCFWQVLGGFIAFLGPELSALLTRTMSRI